METPLQQILGRLEPEHARALDWFLDHEGEIGRRPWRVDGQSVVEGVSIPLVAQRGIHQPSGWSLALSITATRASVYFDGVPQKIDNDTWVLPYKAHDGRDGAGSDSRWNRALMRNMVERMPVGVFVPEGSRYLNLGLAMVESYDLGTSTFLLRGPMRLTQGEGVWAGSTAETMRDPSTGELDDVDLLSEAWQSAEPAVYSRVRRRVAQDRFRDQLLRTYKGKCSVTGYDAPDALQGAHILSYSGRSSQLVTNGLLLRADIHLLFDRHLVAVDPQTHRVCVSPRLMSTAYAYLDKTPVARPERESEAPDSRRLAVHWAVFERSASASA